MPFLIINPADTVRKVFIFKDPFYRVFDPAAGTTPGVFNYKRPGGVDTYHRPDTTSLYKRP